MTNNQISDVFEHLADILEFQGVNTFRVRAYRNAARAIRDYPESIAALARRGPEELQAIEGIGESVAAKCVTLVTTGHLPQLEELLQQVPESVLALLRIPGLGPRKAAALHKELGIQSLDQLRAACEAGRVRELKGFGEKTEQAILHGIGFAETTQQRIYWAAADAIARELREHLGAAPGVEQLEVAGSYRRGKETVGDLDILAVSSRPKEAMDRLEAFPDRAETLARGDTKMSVRLRDGLQVDLRVVPAESFGAALQYFTGSKAHNVELRGRARDRGLKINEYGVFRQTNGQETYLAGATEAEVYQALDLPLFPPELREARWEFGWADAGPLPKLLELSDIRGDLHMHTQATDGQGTLEEMVTAAQALGYAYVAITDHSQRVTMAGGLNPQRLRRQWAQIDKLNQRLEGRFVVLKGVECDILEKGGMDLPDDVLAEADWVLASVHYGQRQPRQQITDRILNALANPYVTAIAHPTGRLINRREPYEVDLDAVMQAAREHHKVLELNAHPARLDLTDIACASARQLGIPVVIDTDAHTTEGLKDMRYGVLQARRGGLTKKDVVNTHTWKQLQKILQRIRGA